MSQVVEAVDGGAVVLDTPGAAKKLNVTERMVRRLVAERRVPFTRVGRYVRFLETDLDQWLQAHRVQPEGEHPLLRRGA